MKDTCALCESGRELDFDFTFAFQPIVDVEDRSVLAYEALVRTLEGGPAYQVLDRLTDETRYAFDQAARVKAIRIATELMGDGTAQLSINILPNAVYDPVRCLRTTLRAANETGFALDRLMFEMTEHEKVNNPKHLRRIIDHYSKCGFTIAIDDFGAGFAGLGLLADFTPHVLKLDMALVRDIHVDRVRQAIVNGTVRTAAELDIKVIAEGVETAQELDHLRASGVRYFQGYYFARPEVERLPVVDFDRLCPRAAPLAVTKPHNTADCSSAMGAQAA